jgi:hypothetical protein
VENPPPTLSFSVYALSRGKGVPDTTQKALKDVRQFLEQEKQKGKVARILESRIGLEGEKRLSVEFNDAKSFREAEKTIREMTTDVELMNLVVEPYEKGSVR